MMAYLKHHIWASVALAVILSACGPRDVIEVEIAELVEADHWGGEMKICTPRYKILNNTEYSIEQITASQVWRDGYGDEVEMPMLLNSVVPADTATRTATGRALYGTCAEVEFLGLRNILTCQLSTLDEAACKERLRIIFRGGVTVKGPATIE